MKSWKQVVCLLWGALSLGCAASTWSAAYPDKPVRMIIRSLPYDVLKDLAPVIFTARALNVLLAPATTPAAIVKRINADTARILETPGMKIALGQQGAQPAGGSPDEFRRFIRSKIEKWGKAIRSANVPPAN